MSLPLFMGLYNRQSGVPDDQASYNLSIPAGHQAQRVQDSIMQNPLFSLSPFDGLLLTGVIHNFIFALMANRSAENPGGRLDRDTLMPFFGVTRDAYSSAFNYISTEPPSFLETRSSRDPYYD